ncbi:MAG TPA: A24 family peptidase C-terminal domain-containing protein [Candidatus Nanoarchaeia archaeon]|nr:A24 family peptidase C-terminal domain-containing protein [Candidatus Nanoarchaeia archaeon]
MQQVVFDAARVIVSLVFLLYSSWSDYKTREVSNKVWAVYAPIAFALTMAELLIYDQSNLLFFGISAGITIGFALLLFYTGAFGGADSKAFMCIALALPFFPTLLLTPILPNGLSPLSQVIFPVTILSNAVLIAALSVLYLLIRNLIRRASSHKPLFEGTLAKESFGKKIMVLLTGQKFPLSTLKAKWHIYPMEDIEQPNETVENGILNRKLIIVPKDEGRDEVIAHLSKAADEGKIDSKVWATPGLPMLIFVTAGLIVALTLGDIVWIFVGHLFG